MARFLWLEYDSTWRYASRAQRVLSDLVEVLGHQCAPISTDGSRTFETQIHSADVLLLLGGGALESSEVVRSSVREAIGAGKRLLAFGTNPSEKIACDFLRLNYGIAPVYVRCWATGSSRYIEVEVHQSERANPSSWFGGLARLWIDGPWLLRCEADAYSVLPLPPGIAFVDPRTDLFTQPDQNGTLVAAWPVTDHPDRPRVLVFGGSIVPNYGPEHKLSANWTALLRVLLLAGVNPPSAEPGLEARGYVNGITACLQRCVVLRLGALYSDMRSCWDLMPPRTREHLTRNSGLAEDVLMNLPVAEALVNADIVDFKEIIRNNWSMFEKDWDPNGETGSKRSTSWIERFNNVRRRVVGHEERLDREPVTDEELRLLATTLPTALETYVRVSSNTHAVHIESQLARWRSLDDWIEVETRARRASSTEEHAEAVAFGVTKAVSKGYVVTIASNVVADSYFEACRQHGRIYVQITLEEDRANLEVAVPQGQQELPVELQDALRLEWQSNLGVDYPVGPIASQFGNIRCYAYPVPLRHVLTVAERTAVLLTRAGRLPAPTTDQPDTIDPRVQGRSATNVVFTKAGKALPLLRLLPNSAAGSVRLHLTSSQYQQVLQLPLPGVDPDGWEAGLSEILSGSQKDSLEQWGETAFTVD
jgi:hypothetical protein